MDLLDAFRTVLSGARNLIDDPAIKDAISNDLAKAEHMASTVIDGAEGALADAEEKIAGWIRGAYTATGTVDTPAAPAETANGGTAVTPDIPAQAPPAAVPAQDTPAAG